MLRSLKKFYKSSPFLCILELCTFLLIIASAIIFKQHPLRVLPLCISLFIMFLQAQVNRYAFLLGGINSVFYAVSYFSMTLYTSAVYALAVSFPLQIITFINWQRKTTKNRTELRRLSKLQLILSAALFAAAWVALFFAFKLMGSSYMILDNTSSLLGIAVTILTLLRFKEYAPLNLVSGVIGLIMHITVFLNDRSQITYVIFSVYSLVCMVATLYNIRRNEKTAE